MTKFNITDFTSFEHWPTSCATLKNKINEMLLNSHQTRVTVEAVNPTTGEYRIVLQGTLDKEETKFDQT